MAPTAPVLLLLTSLAVSAAGQYVTVQTTSGAVRGAASASLNGTAYFRFSGVPFAAPPVGQLRFKPPVSHPGWEGVRDALEEAADCLQAESGQLVGAEDCLYLNVYTPSVSEGALLPTMVWIYGGHFTSGSSSAQVYGPDFLLDQGVVVVAINYRVGVMGLLGLSDPIAQGNNAFKDQTAALQWVRDNIRAFGGDSDKVTIFGQSAGGISVEMLMYSPLSRGLFRGAISQSGSALGGDHIADTNRAIAFCIGAELGLQTDDPEELLAFLQTADAEALHGTSCGTAFQIAVESEEDGAFLTLDHSRLGAWADAGNFSHLPLLTGVTTGEYNLQMQMDAGGVPGIISNSTLEQLNADFAAAIDFALRLGNADDKQRAAVALRQFYFGSNETITADDAEPYAAMMTDLNNGEPADTAVRLLSAAMRQPVFYYQYAYTGSSADTGLPGAPHMADLSSLFYEPRTEQNMDPSSDEQKVRGAVVRLWTNFAKFLNPTPLDDPVVEGGWLAYDAVTRSYLNIDVNTTVQQDRNAQRMDFVHSVIPPYY